MSPAWLPHDMTTAHIPQLVVLKASVLEHSNGSIRLKNSRGQYSKICPSVDQGMNSQRIASANHSSSAN